MGSYETPEPIRLDLMVAAGSIHIETADTDRTVVEIQPAGPRASLDDVREELRDLAGGGRELVLRAPDVRTGLGFLRVPAYRVRITTPHGAAVEVSTASADVTGDGRFARVDAKTASGDLSFDEVDGDVALKTASGDARVARIGGMATATAVSGDLTLPRVEGELRGTTVSGEIEVGGAAASMWLKSVSGDVRVDALSAGQAVVHTVSGDVTLGVRPGRRVWLDLDTKSGDTTTDLDVGEHEGSVADRPLLEIRVVSVSGDIRVHRERTASPAAI